MNSKLLPGLLSLLISLAVMGDYKDHVGKRILTKYEFIDRLKPGPKITLRGIRHNDSEDIQTLTVSMEINFEFDSAKLSDQSLKQLRPLGLALKSAELKSFSFMLEGHTDAIGTEQYNMLLSHKRAISVGEYLYQKFAVEKDRLTIIGKGEHELLDTNSPSSGVNRRVAITTVQN